MYIVNSSSKNFDSPTENSSFVREEYLRYVVESVSIPRHYSVESKNNKLIADWIKNEFENLGLPVVYQGKYNNIVAKHGNPDSNSLVIVGAHYDSVPRSPGADDNASAIAGLLALAKAIKKNELKNSNILFVAFNREEDGLLGSVDFVNSLTKEQINKIKCAHILEMIGYAKNEMGTQIVPPGLPIKISDVGNFIGVIANRHSNDLINIMVKLAEQHIPDLPVTGLKVFWGVEKFFPHLLRSDHAPFWNSNIPALMWTDTSEFRNPHYHKTTDTPDTLNYSFMAKVVSLLEMGILKQLNVNP